MTRTGGVRADVHVASEYAEEPEEHRQLARAK